jgi:GT2 family glycosyltransferase
MNKGARLAVGEWLLFLQADDWLPAGTLEAFRQGIQHHPTADLLCGGAEAVKEADNKWATLWSVTDVVRKRLTLENIALGEPMINARLIRRESFLKLGGFSLEYSLASDRDFLLRASEANLRQEEIPTTTYRYRWHSGSSTMTEGNALTNRLSAENLAVAKKHLSLAKGAQRRVMKQWHTSLTVQAVMNALESPGMPGLFSAISHGCAVDLSWPLCLIAEVARSLPEFLMRRGKTRSSIMREKRKA